MQKQGWNQREAAEAIGCSRQHLNRIINKVCVPSAALCAKMETIMEQPKDTNLEACKEAYPIGNAFIQFYDNPEFWSSVEDYTEYVWEEGAFHYEPDDTSAWLSYVLYSPANKNFHYGEAIFWKILGYFTSDGHIFVPVIDDGVAFNNIHAEHVYLPNPYTNRPFTLNSSKDFVRENIIAYNNIHGTDYIPLFSEEECKKLLEVNNE